MPPGLLDEPEASAAVFRCQRVRRYFLLLIATPSYDMDNSLPGSPVPPWTYVLGISEMSGLKAEHVLLGKPIWQMAMSVSVL